MKEKVLFSFLKIVSLQKKTVDFEGKLKTCILPTGQRGLFFQISETAVTYFQLSDFFRNRVARYSFEKYVLWVLGKKFVWFTKNVLIVDVDNDGVPEKDFGVEWGGDLEELIEAPVSEEEAQSVQKAA
jgi:hypothetical protein